MLYVNTAVMLARLKYVHILLMCVQNLVDYASYVSMLGVDRQTKISIDTYKKARQLSCLAFLYVSSIKNSLRLLCY